MHGVETRFIQHCNRCNAATMDQKSLCLLTILFDKLSPLKSLHRPNKETNYDTNITHARLVSPIIGNIDRKSSSASKTKEHSQRSFKQTTTISDEQLSQASGMAHLKKKFCLLGISQTAFQIITGARRESSVVSYESTWRKWVAWCSEKQISPFHCDAIHILNFFGELFQAAYEYQTICLHRMAIPTYHEQIQGVNIGLHSSFVELIKELFNIRSPKPNIPLFGMCRKFLILLRIIGQIANRQTGIREGVDLKTENVNN